MFARIVFVAASAFIGIGLVSTGGRANAVAPSDETGRWNGTDTEYLALAHGGLHGSDGCNGINGTYIRRDDELEFHRGFSTLRACPGVDTWLRTAARASVDGDTMTVFDRNGTRIGALTRAQPDSE